MGSLFEQDDRLKRHFVKSIPMTLSVLSRQDESHVVFRQIERKNKYLQKNREGGHVLEKCSAIRERDPARAVFLSPCEEIPVAEQEAESQPR
jgi:hypothetical protein